MIDILSECLYNSFAKTSREVARSGKATANARRLSEDFKAERRDPPKNNRSNFFGRFNLLLFIIYKCTFNFTTM